MTQTDPGRGLVNSEFTLSPDNGSYASDAKLAAMIEKNNSLIVPYMDYLLPSLHLGACLAMWLCTYRNLEPMLFIDFPFSFLAVTAAYQGVNPWIILGIVGTLWWYSLSLVIRRIIRFYLPG